MAGLSAIACTPAHPGQPRTQRDHQLHRDLHRHPSGRRRRLRPEHRHHQRARPGQRPASPRPPARRSSPKQSASLCLAKTASPGTSVVAGDVVTYTFAGQNTGTVTLHNVGGHRPHGRALRGHLHPAAPATLAPDATHLLLRHLHRDPGRRRRRQITNTATIDGLDPRNNPVSARARRTNVTATQDARN